MNHCLALQGPSGRHCTSETSFSHSARAVLTNKKANYTANTVKYVSDTYQESHTVQPLQTQSCRKASLCFCYLQTGMLQLPFYLCVVVDTKWLFLYAYQNQKMRTKFFVLDFCLD